MPNISLTTQRLVISPASLEEMKTIYENEPAIDLKLAYSEMIDTMLDLPGREYWGSDWRISLKDGTDIGGAGFKGLPDENGCVEIGCGIDEEYRNKGYSTEAVKAMVSWAFEQPDVLCVQAQTLEDNETAKRVLTKIGMTHVGMGEEGLLFEIHKTN